MTLHEAIVAVIRQHGGWMDRDELARAIAEEGLYVRGDGRSPPSDQLSLSARKYTHLFEGSDPRFSRIRLRDGSGPIPQPARSSVTKAPHQDDSSLDDAQ